MIVKAAESFRFTRVYQNFQAAVPGQIKRTFFCKQGFTQTQMAKKVRITTEAYQNIGLHGMKYAYNNIFGFLIGSEKNQTVSSCSSSHVSASITHRLPLG